MPRICLIARYNCADVPSLLAALRSLGAMIAVHEPVEDLALAPRGERGDIAGMVQQHNEVAQCIQEILPLCRELGLSVTAYGVLSCSLLTGSTGLGEGDLRGALYPRFQGGNLAQNQRLSRALAEVAEAEGITSEQAAIAWVASRGDDVVPLVGAKTVERLTEAIGALRSLPDTALAAIENAVPADEVAGERHMVAG